ncbi:MAG: PilW family protein [Betaproteobacteria bacterium]
MASFIAWSLIAAALMQAVTAKRSQRLQAAQALMIEDAQIAIDLLRNDLMMAGYGRPLRALQSPGGPASWQTTLAAAALWACDHGFASLPASAQPACAAAPAAGGQSSSAVEIAYEADGYSTVLGSDGRPTDCLGNGLDAGVAADGSRVYIAYNRWQVSTSGRSELRCGGRGSTGPQPLVDNVERLLLSWGLPVDAGEATALRFVGAAQVSDFRLVRAVRLCLLLRSSDPVLGPDDVRSYTDCAGSAATSDDGRLRRAFWSTAALRNWSN